MIKFLRRCCESKRECITYLVVFFWVTLGIISTYFSTELTDLAAYFLSLTGFIGAYIFGESIRKSTCTSIFLSGKSSKREAMMYITLVLWFISGIWCIINNADLIGMSAYFAALTPFVGSYIIGETLKKEDNYSSEVQQINS